MDLAFQNTLHNELNALQTECTHLCSIARAFKTTGNNTMAKELEALGVRIYLSLEHVRIDYDRALSKYVRESVETTDRVLGALITATHTAN
ncbi:hypothetical protein [Caldimonas sp. KR1-144]|uniref:hypothetical protein n=1 Tax=Caldimonas sp. KR1-144 TaxID=3400911 RepID=UPI003BFAE81D